MTPAIAQQRPSLHLPALALGAVLLALGAVSPSAQGIAVPRPDPNLSAPVDEPSVRLLSAPPLSFSGEADSNSPVVWELENGLTRLSVITSVAGAPSLATGPRLDQLGPAMPVVLSGTSHGIWMESVIEDEGGDWYGFYHRERPAEICPDSGKMIPEIGAARSSDAGRSWTNLGIVLEASGMTLDCTTPNRYFVGGVGDFTTMLDADHNYLYFFFSQYASRQTGQGVGVARLAWADHDAPVGRVMVWRHNVWLPARPSRAPAPEGSSDVRWSYPLATPIYEAAESWHDDDTEVDAFWGPSVHWNTYLQRYVMLLNRAIDVEWKQEGIYVAFATRLDDPSTWTAPRRILEGGRWYPQVVGTTVGSGTDRVAGQSARFFMSGTSQHLIQFQ